MDTFIDLNDSSAWDDKALVGDWNDILAEYKKYHSIHARGERLEDVLEAYEWEQLKHEMGYEEEIENAEADATDPSKDVRDGEEDDDVAMEISDSEAELDPSGKDDAVGVHAVTEDSSGPGLAEQGTLESVVTAQLNGKGVEQYPQVPQALIASIKDESLKKMMLAWYYAGYYSGLHDGQHGASQGIEEQTKKL